MHYFSLSDLLSSAILRLEKAFSCINFLLSALFLFICVNFYDARFEITSMDSISSNLMSSSRLLDDPIHFLHSLNSLTTDHGEFNY